MNTTADKLNGILNSKEAIRQAIISKGIDVPPSTVFADYASLILQIQSSSNSNSNNNNQQNP